MEDVMEVARFALSPGDELIHTDGSQIIKLYKHSTFDASDYIQNLVNLLDPVVNNRILRMLEEGSSTDEFTIQQIEYKVNPFKTESSFPYKS